jgi:hypothetical protein
MDSLQFQKQRALLSEHFAPQFRSNQRSALALTTVRTDSVAKCSRLSRRNDFRVVEVPEKRDL